MLNWVLVDDIGSLLSALRGNYLFHFEELGELRVVQDVLYQQQGSHLTLDEATSQH